MKSTRLIFLLALLCHVQYSTAQNNNDSIKKWLIQPFKPASLAIADSNWLIIPPGGGQWPPPIIDPWYPYEVIDIGWIDIPWGVFVWVQPQCGETHHDNGKIASSAECKDSVLHGKLTYWNEDGQKTSEQNYAEGQLHGKYISWNTSGHKTYEYTYAYNRVFKEKNYGARGKIQSVEHFKYNKTGTRLNHGVCTYYEGKKKTVKMYDMGSLSGYSRVYENGIKREETLYMNNIILSIQTWNENQQLISETINDSNGRLAHQRNWNEDRVLLKEQYYLNGLAEGCWTNFNPSTFTKIITIYKENKIIKSETFKHEKLVSHSDFTNGNITYSIYYFENGEKSEEHFISESNGNDRRIIKWNLEGEIIENVQYVNDRFIANGFYTNKDSSIFYQADSLNQDLYLKRWVLYKKDTIREEYVMNSFSNRDQILYRNYFKTNKQGVFVRHGEWVNYIENEVNSVITYDAGIVSGRAIYYTSSQEGPVALEYGTYNHGIKEGIWTKMKGHDKHQYTYVNGEKNGWYYKINSRNDTLIKAEYSNNNFNGTYQEFYGSGYPCPGGYFDEANGTTSADYPSGMLKFEGEYVDGKKNGYWYFYLIDGFLKEEGGYEKDKKIGKWIYWSLNEKGRLKKNKVNTARIS